MSEGPAGAEFPSTADRPGPALSPRGGMWQTQVPQVLDRPKGTAYTACRFESCRGLVRYEILTGGHLPCFNGHMHAATRHAVAKVTASYSQPERSCKGKTCEVQCLGSHGYVKCGEPATAEVDGVRVCEDHA